MTIILKDGVKIELHENDKLVQMPPSIAELAEDIRKYTEGNRLHLARIKAQLQEFSCKSLKWRNEK